MKYFLIIVLFGLLSCSEDRDSTKPIYKELIEAVYSSVLIEPMEAYKVNASVSGYIEKILVKEGDIVKAGDVLMIISSKPIQLNQQNALLNYELLKDTYVGEANVIEEMKLDLMSSRLKMQNDSLNYLRFKLLYDKSAVSKFEYDNASLSYEVSKNNYFSLKKRIYRKEIELKNQINQSKNSFNASTLKTADYTIKSNLSGKVFQLFKENGEYISMQEPLAIVGNEKDFIIKMLIDEVDISKIEIDQKVLISLEAFKDKVFEAKINRISPKMDERTQTFEIEAEFITPPTKMYMGLTGEGNIVINEKKKALVIPREFLQSGNKVETEDGMIKVKTGLSNWSYIEILSGVNESTLIYKPK